MWKKLLKKQLNYLSAIRAKKSLLNQFTLVRHGIQYAVIAFRKWRVKPAIVPEN